MEYVGSAEPGDEVTVAGSPVPQCGVQHDPAGLGNWLICIGLASIVLWADEARKLIGRKHGR